jgi:hypothetical protein
LNLAATVALAAKFASAEHMRMVTICVTFGNLAQLILSGAQRHAGTELYLEYGLRIAVELLLVLALVLPQPEPVETTIPLPEAFAAAAAGQLEPLSDSQNTKAKVQ